jgi:hypothetical protein
MNVEQEVLPELIALAVRTARQQRGDNTLQPYATVYLKLLNEVMEFTQAKTQDDEMGEVADIIYYSAQLYAYNCDLELFREVAHMFATELQLPEAAVYKIALEKYRLRTAIPNNKDFKAEAQAMRTALEE